MSRKFISVDASVRDGVCGIAAVVHGRDVRVLFADVTEATGANDGEWQAMEKAMTIANKANFHAVTFRSDLRAIRDRVRKDERLSHFMGSHPLWKVEWIKREHNAAAHTIASEAVRLWIAGRDGVMTNVRSGDVREVA